MLGRFIRDESGMTMGLAIITMVLIGVMGAGLLTFVSTDLNNVVEVNQGQKALEMADAGVRAAQKQLLQDSSPTTSYDGGPDDLPWSYCKGVALCTSASPTATGSSGMRLDMGSNYVTVTILETTAAAPTYKVVSEGRVGEARRKVEAVLKSGGAVGSPRAYLTRGNLTLTGSAVSDGVSFFALRNAMITGSFSLGTTSDTYFGKWAETTGSAPYPNTTTGSYPNTYNSTARGSAQVGIGAYGTITTGGGANAFEGTRSYDSTPVSSTTPKMVSDLSADGTPGQQSTEMTFPFKVPTNDEDKQYIESLRQRALALEQTFPGTRYYIDSNPGNGVDDAGMPAGALTVNDWYASSDFQTVRFYEFQTYSASNIVTYGGGSLPTCSSTTPPRGSIVVQNGDFLMNSNKVFEGAILVRAYNPSTGAVLDPPASATDYTNGSFKGEGSACLKGFANSTGNMQASGTITPGSIPDTASSTGSSGSLQMLSWRELYQ